MDNPTAVVTAVSSGPRGRRSRRFEPEFDERLIDRAVERGNELSQRVGYRRLQLRKTFVRRGGPTDREPPAVGLNRASASYLKLMMTVIWSSAGKGIDPRDLPRTPRLVRALEERQRQEAAKWPPAMRRLLPSDPHTTTFPLVDYAVVLGLDKPKAAGTAAIRRGIQHLESNELIRADRRKGVVPTLQLLREDGTATPYSLPTDKRSSAGDTPEGRYFTLPPTLWSNGWMAALSGRALLVLMALIVQNDINDEPAIFISPSIRESLYGITEDTFSRGAFELEFYGLVTRTSAPARRSWSASGNHIRHQFMLTHETGLAKLPTDHL